MLTGWSLGLRTSSIGTLSFAVSGSRSPPKARRSISSSTARMGLWETLASSPLDRMVTGRLRTPVARPRKSQPPRRRGRIRRQRSERQKKRLSSDCFNELAEKHIAQHVSQFRQSRERIRLLRREFVAVWGDRSVHDIK